MNREIKFRAWDKAYKAMCQTNGGTENLSGWLQNPEVFVVMQYTGLKDKNGVEIYEGDIVSFGSRLRVVTWIKVAAFNLKKITKPEARGTTMKYAPDSEVIGNIMENQELLK